MSDEKKKKDGDTTVTIGNEQVEINLGEPWTCMGIRVSIAQQLFTQWGETINHLQEHVPQAMRWALEHCPDSPLSVTIRARKVSDYDIALATEAMPNEFNEDRIRLSILAQALRELDPGSRIKALDRLDTEGLDNAFCH